MCHLLRSLYGLKQSGRQWNHKFSQFLQAWNLIQSNADPCVFYSTTSPWLATTIFVDDSLAICKVKKLLQEMISYLKTNFDVTTGEVDMYIGLHITRDRASPSIFIDQHRFTETLLAKYGFSKAAPVNTPADPNARLQRPLPNDDEESPVFPYQSCVGSLMYLQTWSRPDISQAVSTVS